MESSPEFIGLNISISSVPPSSTYVSCIKINGRPILPPLMTDSKRMEMRKYKELAIALEVRMEQRKASPSFSLQKEDLEIKTTEEHRADESDMKPIHASTNVESSTSLTENAMQPSTPSPGFDQHFVTKPFHIPEEISLQKGRVDQKGDNDVDSGSSGHSSDVFASIGSSNDTYIIKTDGDADGAGDNRQRHSSQSLDDDENENAQTNPRSDGEASSPSDEENQPRDPKLSPFDSTSPKSSGSGEKEDMVLSCKRKRPAFYFDEADDDGDGGESGDECESETESEATTATADTTLDTSKGTEADDSATRGGRQYHTPDQSHSFEGGENSDTVKQNRERPPLATPQSVGLNRSGSYDVTLSTKIPSSAENTPVKMPSEMDQGKTETDDKDRVGESDSDKENHTGSKSSHSSSRKHIRKLSYTSEQPCDQDHLVASGVKPPVDTQPQAQSELGVIPFPSTSPSRNRNLTPLKFAEYRHTEILTMPTPTTDELDSRLEAMDRNLELLKVGVEQNKKKHLERYMDDVADQYKSPTPFEPKSTPAKDFQKEIEDKFNELQVQQQKQMEYLRQAHEEQERKLKEDFDRQRTFFLQQLNCIPNPTVVNKTSPVPTNTPTNRHPTSPKSLPTTPRNQESENISVKGFMSSARSSTNPFSGTNAAVCHSPAATSVQGQEPSSTTQSDLSPSYPGPRSGLTSAASGTLNTGRSNYPASDWTTDNTDIESKSVMSASTSNTLTEISSVGLSKLQAKMKSLSPMYRKIDIESRSPLLKGVAFPSPLSRSHAPVRVPPKALEPEMAPKYAKITGLVRGYLTRRLLHTEKIQTIIQTIRDTVDFLLRLYEESPNDPTHSQIRPEDVNLHRMLIQQLNGACSSFHGIFFKLTTPERMAIIATDRQKLKAKVLKEHLSLSNPSNGEALKYKRNVSTATLKAMERRLSVNPNAQQPRTPAYHPPRRVPGQAPMGSKSVNPKLLGKAKAGVGISPSSKRRRLSHYVFKPPRNITATVDTGLSASSKRVTTSRSNAATPKFTRPSAVTDQNGNWKSKATGVRSSTATATGALVRNATFTKKGAAEAVGFQANPSAQIQTNFTGNLSPDDVFKSLMGTGASNTREKRSASDMSRQSVNTSASASSTSRFSIGSNLSAHSNTSRKSLNRKPWK